MVTCPNGHPSTATDYCDVCGTPIPPDAVHLPDPAVAAETLATGQALPPGAVLAGGTQPAPASPESVNAAIKSCPNCSSANPGTALFCEACGYDFTTGSLPRMSQFAPPPASDLAAPAPAPVLPRGGATRVPANPLDLDAPVATPVPVPEPAVPAPVVTEPVVTQATGGPAEWVAEVWIDPDWYSGQDSPDQLPSPGLPRVVGLRRRASLIGRPSKSRGITPDVDCEPDTGVSRRHAELGTDGTRWWVSDLGSANGTYVGAAGAPLPLDPIRGRTELAEDSRVYVGSWTRIVVRRANPDEADL